MVFYHVTSDMKNRRLCFQHLEFRSAAFRTQGTALSECLALAVLRISRRFL